MPDTPRKEHNLVTTYIEGYNISTGYRQSSAAITDAPWYYETLVFEWDGKKRGRIVDMDTDATAPAIEVHCTHVRSYLNAEPPEKESDE